MFLRERPRLPAFALHYAAGLQDTGERLPADSERTEGIRGMPSAANRLFMDYI